MQSATFNLIANEAVLAASHCAAGATTLSRANYAQKAFYYQAFFSLSIGFERTCKLILVCDHLAKNGRFPDLNLRSYGHDLQSLFAQVESLKRKTDFPKPNSTVHHNMLRILSSFATNATRYYNLDIIQGIHKGIEDPLSDWYRNVVIPCWEQSVSPRIKRLEEERAIMASSLMEEFAMVRFTSEDGQSISTVKEGAYRTGIWKRTAPYVRLHALQWCRYLTENIIALDQSHQDLPVFSDMYRVFYNDDKMFLGRKTWELV